MKNLIIIPARLESTRLPNKPLADINGEPMIAHVYKRAKEANIAKVIVAAGNVEIKEVIENIGGEAILTNPDHASGSDRIYEALNMYDKESEFDIIVNLQGDLPNIHKDALSKIIHTYLPIHRRWKLPQSSHLVPSPVYRPRVFLLYSQNMRLQ